VGINHEKWTGELQGSRYGRKRGPQGKVQLTLSACFSRERQLPSEKLNREEGGKELGKRPTVEVEIMVRIHEE